MCCHKRYGSKDDGKFLFLVPLFSFIRLLSIIEDTVEPPASDKVPRLFGRSWEVVAYESLNQIGSNFLPYYYKNDDVQEICNFKYKIYM